MKIIPFLLLLFICQSNTSESQTNMLGNISSRDTLFSNNQQSPKPPANKPAEAILVRGPYLNSALQSGIVIRWRTDIATDSRVSCGLTEGNLNQVFTDNNLTTEHIITVTGLTANTLYFYSIGTTAQVLQGDAGNYFKTMPVVGSNQKIRFLAMGDMGANTDNQVNVRNAWQAFNGNNYTDGWLLLGDNAYSYGLDSEYQTNFFDIYQGSLTRNHVLWPSPGNHDYAGSAALQANHLIPYYDLFTLPSNGEAGGVASQTEAFYAFNYGNVHFVSLDSYGWESGNTRLYDTLGPQAVWLKQDLAANTQPWTIIYFHHPPFTKGSHNSDAEFELISMRQKLVPILERYKVDLVLSGHSHSYERSYLINGHYDTENTFLPATHAISRSCAKYDGSPNSCPYIKNASATRNGIVYAVVGSAGQLGGTSVGYPHDAMYYSDVTNGGALYFEVERNRLHAKWICGDSVVRDNFTIMKGVNKNTYIDMIPGKDSLLTASWIGSYNWSTGATTQSIRVSPATDTTYTVSDGEGCLKDTFNIQLRHLSVINLCPPESSTTIQAGITGNTYQWQVATGNGFTDMNDNINYSGTHTGTLQLINVPSAWYGYQYRCMAGGNSSIVYELQFQNTFTGTAGAAWENPVNWSCSSLPDANTSVVINSGNVLLSSNGNCRKVSVKPGATITIGNGFNLTVTK